MNPAPPARRTSALRAGSRAGPPARSRRGAGDVRRSRAPAAQDVRRFPSTPAACGVSLAPLRRSDSKNGSCSQLSRRENWGQRSGVPHCGMNAPSLQGQCTRNAGASGEPRSSRGNRPGIKPCCQAVGSSATKVGNLAPAKASHRCWVRSRRKVTPTLTGRTHRRRHRRPPAERKHAPRQPPGSASRAAFLRIRLETRAAPRRSALLLGGRGWPCKAGGCR